MCAITTVFISSESTDGQYQLKNGSPAKGAGLDGVDCGMFGGPGSLCAIRNP